MSVFFQWLPGNCSYFHASCVRLLSAVSYFLSTASPIIFLIAIMSGIILPLSLLPDDPSPWQMASLWLIFNFPFPGSEFPLLSKTSVPVPGNQCLRVLTADWGLCSLSCSALHVQLDSWAECCAWMPPAASATGFSAILPAQTLTLGILICVNDTNVFPVIWWFWHPSCLQWWGHQFLAHLCQKYL